MSGRWRKVGWMSGLALVLALSYCVISGYFTTMTASGADRLFARTFRPGDSRKSVEDWLASQGYVAGSFHMGRITSYDSLDRREDVAFKGWWMDVIGNQTVAECAGLRSDDVSSLIRVQYPLRDGLLGASEVTVYCFFDSDRRLIKHWVHEFVYSL